MFEWKVEEMALLKERPYDYNGYNGKDFPFSCEFEVSQEDKIEFVDSMTDGKLTYILELVDKYNKEKNSLAKSKYGEINTNSLKAWIKRNDTKKLIDNTYRYGKIYFLGLQRNISYINEKLYDQLHDNFVDEAFHTTLLKCRNDELEYFHEHDEYEILKEKFRNRKYSTTFGVHVSSWSSGKICIYDENDYKKERDITVDELKLLIEKDEELDKIIQKMSKEINIEY